MIEGAELSVFMKDTIKMDAAKAFVPCADNADISFTKRGSEFTQAVIILKRN